MTSRRTFFASLAAALVLDPERALWVPGKKMISVPKPPFLAVGDIVAFGAWPGERYIVTAEARSIESIGDARFARALDPGLDASWLGFSRSQAFRRRPATKMSRVL